MSTKSTYKMLTKNLDRIADDLHQIGEQNNLVDLSAICSVRGYQGGFSQVALG